MGVLPLRSTLLKVHSSTPNKASYNDWARVLSSRVLSVTLIYMNRFVWYIFMSSV